MSGCSSFMEAMMKPIALEHWEPDSQDPRYMRYVGQPKAEAVFRELEQRLDSMGMLPDEYLTLDSEWEGGREIPRGADIFVTTDYGESEGIYLDAYLKWREDGKAVTKPFFTGKTLGETGADLDRMFLISSAVTKAFHGDGGQYSRYLTLHPERNAKTMVLSLTPDEHKLFVTALAEHRERTREQLDSTEKLLRRMTGSITEYMSIVGEHPLRISDYDRAVLAVHDGELRAFKDLLPRVMDRTGDLLIEAAGRCGDVGRKMCVELLTSAGSFTAEEYTAASRKAVDTHDTERVRFLLEQAEQMVPDLEDSYYDQIIGYAATVDEEMESALIGEAPDAQEHSAPTMEMCL